MSPDTRTPLQAIIRFYTIGLLLFGCLVTSQAEALDISPFRDELLGIDSNGQATKINRKLDRKEVANLGRVIRLPTLVPPDRVSAIKTKFSIWNRANRNPPTIAFEPKRTYHLDVGALARSGFQPFSRRTIILCPGYLSPENTPWVEELARLWLELEDVNVITVGWSSATFYSGAVADTPLVARQITILLYYLAAVNGANFNDDSFLEKIHIIGHSLGAHISGFVGTDFGGRIGRITGLDPAGPSFDSMSPKYRLDAQDAQLVDVIHTNAGRIKYLGTAITAVPRLAGKLLYKLPGMNSIASSIIDHYRSIDGILAFGIAENVGDLDFFANNGKRQPGCNDPTQICDHGRAYEIYKDLLLHELAIRRAGVDRYQHQVMAFRANSYSDFKNGNDLRDQCPAALDEPLQSVRELASCSVPIDPLTPVNDLIRRLNKVHGIRVNKTASDEVAASEATATNDEDRPRLYFRTPRSQAFLGQQLMLTIKFHKPRSWHVDCQLKVDIVQANGEVSQVSIDGSSLLNSRVVADQPDQMAIAMPVTIAQNRQDPAIEGRSNQFTLSSDSKFFKFAKVPYWMPAQLRLKTDEKMRQGIIGGAVRGATELFADPVLLEPLPEIIAEAPGATTQIVHWLASRKARALEKTSELLMPRSEPGWRRRKRGRALSLLESVRLFGLETEPWCSLRVASVSLRPLNGELVNVGILYDYLETGQAGLKRLVRDQYRYLLAEGYIDKRMFTSDSPLELWPMAAFVR